MAGRNQPKGVPGKLDTNKKLEFNTSKLSRLVHAQNRQTSIPIAQEDIDMTVASATVDSLDDAAMQMQLANMTFNASSIKEQLKNCNMQELYNKAPKSRHNPPGMIAGPIYIQPTSKVEKWTYQLLVESKPLSKFIDYVINDLRRLYERLYTSSSVQHEFEWSIIVDKYVFQV